ncbi:glycoside hydrolase family 13 protein [Heyndrickxia acidicola]|uniref:oligo-1,6-glucosidase n=1 Tax=Heyndrickxia acidicola TaxID=209389 RepID=A0ABU6MK53_9BACI|nr:alpha-glucosidase [Heyndrickxia acidicola]MED1203430.1 alpha-glucosidase [Heyndrickxia acidicola]
MKQTWWKDSVIYQIYPRSFMDSNGDGVGDLRGVIMKLDYLKKLGIDVIWLSPIFKSPNADNGYDVSDYQDIMTEFGTMADFDELLEEAHKRGLHIMLDLVVNHSSDEHKWFVESRSSKDNPYRDYYIWHPGKENGQPPSNWGAAWGDSAWKYDEKTGEYYLHLFHEKQPDLNWENPKLRQEVYRMMNFWLDKGVDGFRMDVINFISKVPGFPDGEMIAGAKFGDSGPHFLNGPRIHEFLQEMNRESLSKYNVVTVGEMPGANVEQAKLYTGEERNELNMIFHFEHVDIGNGRYGKWDPQQWKLSELKRIFSRWQTGLEEAGWNSLYWSNHDQPRAVSRWANDSEEYREISAKMIATCLHFLKGTPYVYQGEELGMTNVSFEKVEDYRDVETLNAFRDLYGEGRLSLEEMMRGIHERSRDNARTPIHWDDNENGGFTTGTPWIEVNPNYKQINAKQALEDEHSIFYYYQTLIRLRKEEPVMVHGAYDVLLEDHEQLWAYTRTLENEQLLVVCNFSDTRQDFELPESPAYQRHELLIANREIEEGSSAQSFTLEPYEARVYKLFK